MNIEAAEKEIRALARRLGVKPFQVRVAIEGIEDIAPMAAPTLVVNLLPPRVMARSTSSGVPVEKERPIRSPAYLKAVASLPCCNCERDGASQAAHLNRGKGMAIKASDNHTFPLCATVGGQQGCHERYDQHMLGDKHHSAELGKRWAIETYAKLQRLRMVPMNVLPPKF